MQVKAHDSLSREEFLFPVTVTQLPVTRCEICQRTVAYRPGEASAALTKHYELRHKEALGMLPRATQHGVSVTSNRDI